VKGLAISAALLLIGSGVAIAQRSSPPPSNPPPKTGPFPLPPIGPKALPAIPDAAKGGDGGRKGATPAGQRGKPDGKTGAGTQTPGEQLVQTPTGTLVTIDGCVEYEEAGRRYVITSSKDRNAPKVPLEASEDVKANVNHRVAIVGTSRQTTGGQGTSAVKVDKLEVLKTSCEK
jgi:hypothetical protein